jgi:hypothetical protein
MEQTPISDLVMMTMDLVERGGPCPSRRELHLTFWAGFGSLTVGKLYCRHISLKAAIQKLGGSCVWIWIDRDVGGYLLDYIYREESLRKL